MLDWILIIVGVIIYAILLRKQLNKIKGKKKADAFTLKNMKTVRECKKCKKTRTRKFKRGDYISKEDKKCKCGQKTVITGIYHEKPKTRKQLKWEREMEKWQ